MVATFQFLPFFGELRVAGKGLGCGSSHGLGTHSLWTVLSPSWASVLASGEWVQVTPGARTMKSRPRCRTWACPQLAHLPLVSQAQVQNSVPLKDNP